MIECFDSDKNATPLRLFTEENFQDWYASQSQNIKKWLDTTGFRGKYRDLAIIPNDKGEMDSVTYIYSQGDLLDFGYLQRSLPPGVYKLATETPESNDLALGWALEAYRFDRFRSMEPCKAKLVWPSDSKEAQLANAIYWVRDLINRPANDLPPEVFASEAETMAEKLGATVKLVKGDRLLEENFPAVYSVGQAGPTPHLIDILWGNPDHPKLTLVGKGVCFDTGGLDIKGAGHMKLMKKDMGGAAIALGLGKLIMEEKLPIRLRIIVAAVENSVSSNSLHPGDIINTRKGVTVEVGNTDAEGRLILADCLTLAVEDKPDLIMDFATLTGAARVALGPDLPALMSNNDSIAQDIYECGKRVRDFVWQLPLWQGYDRYVNGKLADLTNDPSVPFAGAINAGLFLEHFVEKLPWVHMDVFAYNPTTLPGRPEGGEATGLRCVYSYIREKFVS